MEEMQRMVFLPHLEMWKRMQKSRKSLNLEQKRRTQLLRRSISLERSQHRKRLLPERRKRVMLLSQSV